MQIPGEALEVPWTNSKVAGLRSRSFRVRIPEEPFAPKRAFSPLV